MRKFAAGILTFFFLIFTFLTALMIWASRTWKYISFDEIVFHLTNSVEGTGSDIINSFIFCVAVPVVLLTILFAVVLGIFISKKKKFAFNVTALTCMLVVIESTVLMAFLVNDQYGIARYFESKQEQSSFIEENYVDPEVVNISFPEQKRNLIYIYLESMEMSFSDEENGGGFEINYIPELTEIALSDDADCFNGDTGILNGGISTAGSNWTMGAIVSHTGAVPQLTMTENMVAYSSDTFYPNLIALGDILEAEGYNQMFMCGSDAKFGGRQTYFKEHGNYDIFDYNYALEEEYIPEDYRVNWGFEDEKLFEYAKEQLTELASDDEPFNFTMLTVDTHFPDGYICELCDDEYDIQYANVLACSSAQVAEFIKWIQEQDFYENTTVVICGDHPTMDSFGAMADDDFKRRIYTCILNSAAEPESDEYRTFTTLDMMPTTLAAMGCSIEGNKLGLGTNLYSSVPTLIETYDEEHINSEFMKSTDFFDNLGTPDNFSQSILSGTNKMQVGSQLVVGGADEGSVFLSVTGIENTDTQLSSLIYDITDLDGNNLSHGEFEIDADKVYRAHAYLEGDYRLTDTLLIITAVDMDGVEHKTYEARLNASAVPGYSQVSIAQLVYMMNTYENCNVLIAVHDEALGSLSDEEVNLLNSLGLNVSNKGTTRASYAAVYDTATDTVLVEKTSFDAVKFGGLLPDGTPYKLYSAGFSAGSFCTIILNNSDCAVHNRGINAVFYDKDSGVVMNSVSCDVYVDESSTDYPPEQSDWVSSIFTFTKTDDDTLTLSFPSIVWSGSTWTPHSAWIYIWDESNPAAIHKYELTRIVNDNGSPAEWECEDIDISGLDEDTLHFSVYLYNSEAGVISSARYKVNITE